MGPTLRMREHRGGRRRNMHFPGNDEGLLHFSLPRAGFGRSES
jgi:hypothetical protein